MKPMKRLLLPLAVLVSISFASCKSESSKDSAANSSGPAATPAAESAPLPPGAEEISEASLQKDVRQNPDDPTAHFNLGGMYLAEGKYAEAAEEFRFVASKNPKDVEALARLGIAYAS